jgi:hypothetical protein
VRPLRWEGLALVLGAGSVGLFALYVNSFSEGYDGVWGTPVKVAAWALLLAAVAAAIHGAVARFRGRR